MFSRIVKTLAIQLDIKFKNWTLINDAHELIRRLLIMLQKKLRSNYPFTLEHKWHKQTLQYNYYTPY
jgi:hypothetical protein